jgi:hypothetical protein
MLSRRGMLYKIIIIILVFPRFVDGMQYENQSLSYVSKACQRCRTMHKGCDERRPCDRCVRANEACEETTAKKPGPKTKAVKSPSKVGKSQSAKNSHPKKSIESSLVPGSFSYSVSNKTSTSNGSAFSMSTEVQDGSDCHYWYFTGHPYLIAPAHDDEIYPDEMNAFGGL